MSALEQQQLSIRDFFHTKEAIRFSIPKLIHARLLANIFRGGQMWLQNDISFPTRFASRKGPSSHACRCKDWVMSCARQLHPWCQTVFPVPSASAFCKHGDFIHPAEDRGLQGCPVPSAPSWSRKRAYLSPFSSASVCGIPVTLTSQSSNSAHKLDRERLLIPSALDNLSHLFGK